MKDTKLEYPKKKKQERKLQTVDELQIMGSSGKRNPSRCKIRYTPAAQQARHGSETY